MGFHFSTDDGRDFKLNAWSWRPLHEAIAAAGILPAELWECASYNNGTPFEPEEVALLCHFLEKRLLPGLQPGERRLLNDSVTAEPDDGHFNRAPEDQWLNYGISYESAAALLAFLRTTNGRVTIG